MPKTKQLSCQLLEIFSKIKIFLHQMKGLTLECRLNIHLLGGYNEFFSYLKNRAKQPEAEIENGVAYKKKSV